MSTGRPRSARASISTRPNAAGPVRRAASFGLRAAAGAVLVAAGVTAAAPAANDPLRAAERELARTADLYLVIAAEPPAAEVKARGLTLERLPLEGVAVLLRHEPGGGTAPAALPAVWRVSEEGAVDAPRKLIAPAELVPAPSEDGGEAEEDAAAPAAGAPAAAEDEPLPEPPAEYRVGLDGGWELWIGAGLPSTGPLARFAAAVAGGWRALWGSGPEPLPGAIALAADRETAQRLHHLFRAGLPVLVAGPAPGAPAPGPAVADVRR